MKASAVCEELDVPLDDLWQTWELPKSRRWAAGREPTLLPALLACMHLLVPVYSFLGISTALRKR
jgi:hypothetical protein